MKRNRVIFSSLMVMVAFFNTEVYWSMRSIWFFINKTLGSLFGIDRFWSLCIWVLLLAFTTYTIALLMICVKKSRDKRSKKINLILPVILGIVFTRFNLYIYNMLGPDKHIVARNLMISLPKLLMVGLILFFILFFPRIKMSKNPKIRYLMAGLFLVIAVMYIFNFGKVKITSGPYFQYIDDNNYAVMWTTNKESTGWVEYGHNEEQLTKKTSSDLGLVDANSTVHKVILPVTQTDTLFRVGSTKIKGHYQTNMGYGNTVYSDFIKYEDNKNQEDLTFYVLSDIHERKEIYKKFLAKDNYDFLVLNGDVLSSVDSDNIIINEMLKPLTLYTDGFKPFYFVRGNHEPRGAAARELPNYLALPNGSYYYTFSYGTVFAVVLDSGEDKLDDHEEYGGLSDFEEYRRVETEWLKEVVQSEDYKSAKYKIAFTHIPLNSYGTLEDNSPLKTCEKEWIELLNSMEIDAVFSGHTHISELIEAEGDLYQFPMFIGGGNTGDGESYVGIKVEVKGDQMKALFVNEEGEVMREYEINK